MDIQNNKFFKKIMLIILFSVCIGILYFLLFSSETFRQYYNTILPKQPAILWGYLPLIILDIIFGSIIGKSARDRIILIISGTIISIITNISALIINMYQVYRDFN